MQAFAVVAAGRDGYAPGSDGAAAVDDMTRPFDDFRALMRALPPGNDAAAERLRGLFAQADKPAGSLGRIEDIALWLARWSGRAPPAVQRPVVAVFAATHGIARHAISAQAADAAQRWVKLSATGGAAVNQLCLAYDLGLKVFDLALDMPSGDISVESALDERGCAATLAFGMETIAGGTDLLCIGSLGVGGSTVAAALSAALFGGTGADWVGAGSGAGVKAAQKAEMVDRALRHHAHGFDDPLEALRRVGGRDVAAIAGAIVAARMEKIPVILDGYAALAAAAVLHRLKVDALGHCLLADAGKEPGQRRLAELIGLAPLFDLRLGQEPSAGAALGGGLAKAAALCASGMAAALQD